MAGVLEVVKEAAKEARKLWTVVPASSESPPETRYGESVDDMLAMAAKCLGASLAEVRPIVLLPAGFGRGTVAEEDAVVLFVDARLNPAEGEARAKEGGGGGGGGDDNTRVSLLARAAGRLDAAVRGPAVVGRVRHDLANPLAVSLGKEAAPALLSERCC